jgi:nicotinamide-nucleotide amidase
MTDKSSPLDSDNLVDHAARVLSAAQERELHIATAESCTGGQLASLLTDIEGLSHVFDRGFVTYSVEAKCEMLGLEPDFIARHNAVSREVALAMAQAAHERSQGAIAVAITGYAGPPGKDEDGEEGLVHLACTGNDGTTRHRAERFGPIGRDPIRRAAMEVALELIEDAIGK